MMLDLSRLKKRVIAMSVDSFLCLLTVAVAYYLRLGVWILPHGAQWFAYVVALILAIPVFITFGLYRAIFRYAGWGALVVVTQACAVFGLLYASIFTVAGVAEVPRTIGLIQPLLLVLVIGAARALTRYWLGGGYRMLNRFNSRRRVLIYGAGSSGRQLAAGLSNSDDMLVVGFVDDDRKMHRSVLNGKIIYPSDDLDALIAKLAVTDLLLAIPSASRSRRNEILELVRNTSATIRTVPGLADLANGRVTVNDLRELEIEDLLGRDAVAPDSQLLGKNITGKTVLVTGAGGSIGSELCRQALLMKPAVLLLVELGEFNLYSIHRDIEKLIANASIYTTQVVPLLASVQDEMQMDRILAAWRPDTIYHAAAYKHVPLVEHNPIEGVKNNVFGTLNTACLARKYDVADFVLISTDKAVRPTNVMGATKRAAEQILQALAAEPGKTRFSMVRFGNVLGSSGSVVPLFRKQIKAGGPVTLTHKDMTRYFMTIPEAAELVIQAGAMAVGGEVFVLDMGDPVRIVDLATRMIELSGLTVESPDNPDGDIAIEITGLRPGEKLFEELLIGDNPTETSHSRIMKARDDHMSWQNMDRELKSMRQAIEQEDINRLRQVLKRIVPEFVSKALPPAKLPRLLSTLAS